MSTVPSKLAERSTNVAEAYAEDGAAMSAMQNLVDDIAAIRGIIEPAPDQNRRLPRAAVVAEEVAAGLQFRHEVPRCGELADAQ